MYACVVVSLVFINYLVISSYTISLKNSLYMFAPSQFSSWVRPCFLSYSAVSHTHTWRANVLGGHCQCFFLNPCIFIYLCRKFSNKIKTKLFLNPCILFTRTFLKWNWKRWYMLGFELLDQPDCWWLVRTVSCI